MSTLKAGDQFAGVIVAAPGLPELDYKVPADMFVAVGDRVLVTLVKRRVVGIVVSLKTSTEIAGSRLKSILTVLNDIEPLRVEWLALTKFAGLYYQHSWGEAALTALPLFFRRAPVRTHAKWLEKARADRPLEMKPVVRLELNAEQRSAVEAVEKSEGFAPFVLFGVTGSGKTEVYLNLIEDALGKTPDGQVLLLVPEINLTPQLEGRVRGRFPGERVVALNSEKSDSERASAWLAVHEGRARVLVGTRMAMLASFKKLVLVIVDEEHDGSFKAGDGLRYSARDLAVWRASKNRCPVILGSATPSLETWMKVKKGDYRLLELKHRAASKAELPSIELIAPPERGSGTALSAAAREAVDAVLAEGRQVILFMNRRGYAPVLSCGACGWVSSCPRCSAFTVFHKLERRLVCHHCGWSRPVPDACPGCGNVDILPRGTGTERIEEELGKTFPGKRILRIDRDSVSRKGEAEEAFAKVHRGEVDLLVGTQMIAKGHDFQNVGLVLILNADAQILSPMTRAREHLFATLMQVAGRAGRSGARGRVLIQTRFPGDPLFAALASQNYPRFADQLLEEREANLCVPFVYQALLRAESSTLAQALAFLRDAAKLGFVTAPETVRVYDPVPMTLVRLMNRERAQLLVEADDRLSLNRFLKTWSAQLPQTSAVSWVLEVDPADI